MPCLLLADNVLLHFYMTQPDAVNPPCHGFVSTSALYRHNHTAASLLCFPRIKFHFSFISILFQLNEWSQWRLNSCQRWGTGDGSGVPVPGEAASCLLPRGSEWGSPVPTSWAPWSASGSQRSMHIHCLGIMKIKVWLCFGSGSHTRIGKIIFSKVLKRFVTHAFLI